MAQNGATLLEAHTLINGEKRERYGEATPEFMRTAAMWSAYLGTDLDGHDVACMMALLKLARETHSRLHDNLVDAAGYIGLAADMADKGINDTELAKLKEIAETADGMKSDDWEYYRVGNPDRDKPEYVVADFNDSGCGHVCNAREQEIAAYIAAASPQTILALIARIERRQGKIGN